MAFILGGAAAAAVAGGVAVKRAEGEMNELFANEEDSKATKKVEKLNEKMVCSLPSSSSLRSYTLTVTSMLTCILHAHSHLPHMFGTDEERGEG